MRFVTYDSNGTLTGCFLQDVLPEDGLYFEISEDEARAWPNYQMNAARDGLELVDAVAPPNSTLSAADGEAAIQSSLDSLARTWGYDDIKSAATYVGDPFERFNAEGTALRNWRSATWAAAAALDAAVLAGHAIAPSSVSELLSAMPAAPTRPE